MSVDMSKYLGLFVTESTEHLEALGRELVELEKAGADRAELVASMFRHAHSVKGMAGSMGFDHTTRLAHRLEDLLGAVRTDPSRLQGDLVDLMLAGVDALLAHVRAAASGTESTLGLDLEPRLIEEARALAAAGKASSSVPAASAAAPATAAASGSEEGPAPSVKPAEGVSGGLLGLPPRFQVRVRIAQGCAVPGVRAFLVYKRLSSLGNVFDLRPALEDLKAGRIPDGLLSAVLETTSGDGAIAGVVNAISEVELVSVQSIAPAPPSMAPAPPPAPAIEAPRVVGQVDSARTVRVRAELLDYFLDTVGELLLATARIREVGRMVAAPARPVFDETVDGLHALVKDLHDKVMKARMMPLSVVTDRLPRAARDIARRRGKELDLVVSGAEIELDRSIVDELADPLLHLLRNSIDHGIEVPDERAGAGKSRRGRVSVSVRRLRERVVLELEDDGRGMDVDKLKAAALAQGHLTAEGAAHLADKEAFLLCCLPGVSTARDVSDISGRGVGMDAVKRVVENVGGTLEIDSERGQGTRFTLKLPLTVAVVNLLLVAVGDEIFGLPITKVLAVLELGEAQLSRSREALLLPFGNTLLQIHDLATLLAVPPGRAPPTRPYVVMEGESGKVALAVDRLVGQQEVVLKALSRPLDLVPGLSGVTILGTGRPIFILDVPRLLAA